MEIKVGHRYQPTFFIIREGDEMQPAWNIHRDKLEARSEMKKLERYTQAKSKLEMHAHSKIEKTLHMKNSKSVDKLRKKNQRPTNEEIEPED